MSIDTSGPSPQARTTLARATAGYDPQFEAALAEAIFAAIMGASKVTDADTVALRSGETVSALVSALITIAATMPSMAVPSRQRQFAEGLAKRVRRGLAQCRQDPDFLDVLLAATTAEGNA